MSDEAVKVQYEGVCEEISEKNGWTAFAISVEGNNYPVRLSTKLPALIEQGRAAGQSRAVWTAKESDGAENPNKPGTRYRNRYLEAVEVGGTVTENPPAANASGQASRNAPAHAPLASGDKDRAITRMAVLKVAAAIVAAGKAVPTETSDAGEDTIRLAARFETWVMRDVDDIPF